MQDDSTASAGEGAAASGETADSGRGPRLFPAQGQPGEGQPAEADRPDTGDQRVDQAVAALGRLPASPVEEHVAVFEGIHGKLRQVLSELDADPQPGDSGS